MMYNVWYGNPVWLNFYIYQIGFIYCAYANHADIVDMGMLMDLSRYYRPPWFQQAGVLDISPRRILGNLSCVGWMTCSAVWRPLLLPGIYWEVIILLLAEVERCLWDAELSVICQRWLLWSSVCTSWELFIQLCFWHLFNLIFCHCVSGNNPLIKFPVCHS